MAAPIYKFMLKAGADGAEQLTFPVWKDDLSMEYEQESQQMFFRRKLSSSLVYLREDYDIIMAQPFGTVFFVIIYKSDDRGLSWAEYWRGRFTMTDCTVSVDDKRVTVKPDVVDNYTEVMAGLEKEYDLIQLKPSIQPMLIRKRPLIQVYTEGDDIVSCFMGNISFEQDADVPQDVSDVGRWLRNHCHFNVISDYTELNFTSVPTAYQADFAQPFTGILKNGQ